MRTCWGSRAARRRCAASSAAGTVPSGAIDTAAVMWFQGRGAYLLDLSARKPLLYRCMHSSRRGVSQRFAVRVKRTSRAVPA